MGRVGSDRTSALRLGTRLIYGGILRWKKAFQRSCDDSTALLGRTITLLRVARSIHR